jgi:hypothetical protein
MKRYKSPGIEICEEFIQAGGKILHKLHHSVWNKEKLPQQWK